MNRKLLMVGCLLMTGSLVGLAGCGKKSDPAPASSHQEPSSRGETEPVTCVYESEAGLECVVRIHDQEAWVFLPEGTMQLAQMPSASGAKFTDGSVTLWTRGEEATLTRPDQPDVVLQNNRRLAVWEHAKLNGADFRAVGNEPGWVLELYGDGRAIFTGNYGKARYEFVLPAPQVDSSNRQTTYECQGPKHELTIVLTGIRCRDTMADEEFETTVRLVLDGKEFTGCGRALH